MRSTKTVIAAILAVLVALSCGEISAQNRNKRKKIPELPPVEDSAEYATHSGGEMPQPKEKIDWSVVDLDTLQLFPKHIPPEVYPQYRYGGVQGLKYEVEQRIRMPKTLRTEMRSKGLSFIRVFVLFIVEKDGSVSDVKCYRSGFTDLETNQEVINLLTPLFLSERSWTPGSHNGRAVRTEICLPADFRLNY